MPRFHRRRCFHRRRFHAGALALSASALLVLSGGAGAHAQAFCELRDPVRQIYELMPEATAHRSVVRSVGSAAREATAAALPFTIHFNELGRHTLYVGMDGDTPLGLVHVRSEAGRWGLVEIAWSLGLDLGVRDFAFQRCRDSARKAVMDPSIADQIRGRSFAELREMLSEDGSGLSGKGLRLPEGTEPGVKELLVTTLRSALKTQMVTHTTWHSDLEAIRWIARGHSAFEGASVVEKVEDPWAPATLRAALEQGVGRATSLDREQAVVLRVRGAADEVLGLVVHTPWSMEGQREWIWWTIDADGRLVAIDAGEARSEAALAFEALRGTTLDDFHRCSTAVELAGKEVMLLATHHLGARVLASAHAEGSP